MTRPDKPVAGESPPGNASLHSEVWRVLQRLEALPVAPLQGHRLGELARHFLTLQHNDGAERANAEMQIWAIWCEHPERAACSAMEAGIQLLESGDLQQAHALFGELVRQQPEWAEAWNKRATVSFLLGKDCASVREIGRALELEPRHFGALGGFARICARNGANDAAHTALKRLQQLNPAAPGVASAVAATAAAAPTTLH